MEERLQKLLAQAGFGSRRACEEFITQGRVRVNGMVALLGQKADPQKDAIMFDGELLAKPEKLTYILLYKPRGVVSSLEPQGDRKTVRDLVPGDERLYPVGRLDLDSEGLILLTNDGDLTNRLTHPRYETEKEYRVLVADEPDAKQLNTWRRGVMLEGKRTAPAQVERESHSAEGVWLKVVMHEGRKHEIRDIAKTLGLWVHKLVRVRMGNLRIGNLKPGQWRTLEPHEVRELTMPAPKPKAQARRPRPAGRGPKTEAWRPKPEGRNPKSGGRKPALEVGRRKPAGGGRRPGRKSSGG